VLPRVSVIVPAYNEVSTLAALLQDLRAARPDEIIVVDGSSTDGTAELARRAAGARLIQTRPCRALQMNAGAKAAVGDVLLFLHADVRLPARGLESLRRAMSHCSVIGGNFNICYQGDDLAAKTFTFINRHRRRFGVFYGDSGIFCRRLIFDQLGGFRPWPILEDYEFARRLWKIGNLAFLDDPLYVSDRRWRRSGVVRTASAWVLIQGLYILGVSPARLARFYAHVR
jgi:rSAM/selenodomain-associated transferase 2